MDEVSSSIISLRQRREKRAKAAAFLSTASAKNSEMTPLKWSDLDEIPDWCYWPKARIKQLALVSGALFTAPAVRMWIEAEKIEAARTIIGGELFERIMTLDTLPNVVYPFPEDIDLNELFIATGAGVMLNSIPRQSLRDRIAFLLPQPVGVLTHNVARLLWLQALTLIDATNFPESKV